MVHCMIAFAARKDKRGGVKIISPIYHNSADGDSVVMVAVGCDVTTVIFRLFFATNY